MCSHTHLCVFSSICIMPTLFLMLSFFSNPRRKNNTKKGQKMGRKRIINFKLHFPVVRKIHEIEYAHHPLTKVLVSIWLGSGCVLESVGNGGDNDGDGAKTIGPREGQKRWRNGNICIDWLIVRKLWSHTCQKYKSDDSVTWSHGESRGRKKEERERIGRRYI